MGKFSSALVAFSVAVSSAWSTSAMASHSYTFQGPIEFYKGIQLSCLATIIKTPDHDPVTGSDLNTGTVVIYITTSLSPLCMAMDVTSNPMNYVQGPADKDGWKSMTILGFRTQTFTLGNCAGDMVVKKREVSPGLWEMDVETVVPEEFAGGPCYFYGIIPSI